MTPYPWILGMEVGNGTKTVKSTSLRWTASAESGSLVDVYTFDPTNTDRNSPTLDCGGADIDPLIHFSNNGNGPPLTGLDIDLTIPDPNRLGFQVDINAVETASYDVSLPVSALPAVPAFSPSGIALCVASPLGLSRLHPATTAPNQMTPLTARPAEIGRRFPSAYTPQSPPHLPAPWPHESSRTQAVMRRITA